MVIVLYYFFQFDIICNRKTENIPNVMEDLGEISVADPDQVRILSLLLIRIRIR